MWDHASTAAVMADGKVIACISEERFSRIKNDERYPTLAIEAVLSQAGISASELDAVIFDSEDVDLTQVLVRKYSGFSVLDRLREQREFFYPQIYEGKNVQYLDIFKDRIDVDQDGGDWGSVIDFVRDGNPDQRKEFYQEFRRKAVSNHLGISPDKVRFGNHHRGHRYYAYYGSPLEKRNVLILTADAWGDQMNATVSHANGSGIKVLSTSNNFQCGRLYRYMTLLLGMRPEEHEYKVMGLAAYSKPEYFDGPYKVFKETQYVEGLGFNYHVKPQDTYDYFRDRLEGYRFDSIAGALQQYTEDILVEWVCNGLKESGANKVVFAGGVGMNVKAMKEIAKLPDLADLFVCPSPSDESLAIGAAYAYFHDFYKANGIDPSEKLRPLPDAYLGSAASATEVEGVAKEFRNNPAYSVTNLMDTDMVAQRISEGKIIGRCVGRAEFGARALGNRSIIADPRRLDIVRRINDSIKNRDFWMPFAPSILAERESDYLVNKKNIAAPYMTQAFETTELAKKDLIAGLHQADLTSRPQVLNRQQNPEYHDLVSAFQEVTGVGGVLNTSFNLHGEPIVQSPEDAARVFRISNMDMLILDGCVIEKNDR
jgi:carbamoyltransferase